MANNGTHNGTHTPYLRLALGDNAEENRNWELLDTKAFNLARELIADIPAGGVLTGFYPDPGLADGVVYDQHIVNVDWSKILNAPAPGGDSLWTDDGISLTPLSPTRSLHLSLTNEASIFWGTGPRPFIKSFSNGEIRLSAPAATAISFDFNNTGGMTLFPDVLSLGKAIILGPNTNTPPSEGSIDYDIATHTHRSYNGTAWVPIPGAGGGVTNPIVLGSRLIKTHLQAANDRDHSYLALNEQWDNVSAWVQDDPTKVGWVTRMTIAEDNWSVIRSTAGGSSIQNMLVCDNSGFLTALGGLIAPGVNTVAQLNIGPGTYKGRLRVYQHAMVLNVNATDFGTQDDNTRPTWQQTFDLSADTLTIDRRAPAGGNANLLTLRGSNGALVAGKEIIQATTITCKAHSFMNTNNTVYLSNNVSFNGATALDDITVPSWLINYGGAAGGDNFRVRRAAPNDTTFVDLLHLTNDGTLVVPGSGPNPLMLGARTIKSRMVCFPTSDIVYWAVNAALNAGGTAWVQDDTAKASWNLALDAASDVMRCYRVAPGTTTATSLLHLSSVGDLTIAGSVANKPTGTTWANPSDRRLKEEIEDYATGLAAICQLQPRTFLYNGKGGSTAGMRGYGFVADEVAPVMPETVGVRAGKLSPLDETETDILTLDQSNLILALVNAVKELSAKVDSLEAN